MNKEWLYYYDKRKLNANSGVIFKGRNYRCYYISFPSLFKEPARGTEILQIYNFRPKEKARGSVVILHGLGTRNIEFLLWMGTHLASAGVNAIMPVLPGNYTRIEDGAYYGTRYIWPDSQVIHNAHSHAVIDVLTTIDYFVQEGLWHDNNCMMGYCLGGMICTVASAIDDRINQTIMMTTGGNMPRLIYESRVSGFVKRMSHEGRITDPRIHNRDKLFDEYDSQWDTVKNMTLDELLLSKEIHPLYKVDPMAFAKFLDKKKVTAIDALFDRTISLASRKSFFKQLKGAKRYVLPISHVSWLPLEFLLAKYILHKVNIFDSLMTSRMLGKESIKSIAENDETGIVRSLQEKITKK